MMIDKTLTCTLVIFSQYSGLKFPAVFLQKIEFFAFHRLLNILCAVSAYNRSPHEWEKINGKNQIENNQRAGIPK